MARGRAADRPDPWSGKSICGHILPRSDNTPSQLAVDGLESALGLLMPTVPWCPPYGLHFEIQCRGKHLGLSTPSAHPHGRIMSRHHGRNIRIYLYSAVCLMPIFSDLPNYFLLQEDCNPSHNLPVLSDLKYGCKPLETNILSIRYVLL